MNDQVVDGTEIIAEFDLRGASHGLYDVAVINPDGAEAIVPYRYLVEQSIAQDVTVGLGGPRVIAPGDQASFGVTVSSATNLDTPYVFFQLGIPALGINTQLFNFRFGDFASNVGGQPRAADTPGSPLADVPWASLDSTLNTSGLNLAPGYVFDLATGGTATQTFTTATYPGLKALLAASDVAQQSGRDVAFQQLAEALNNAYPQVHVTQLSDLDKFFPGLGEAFQAALNGDDPLQG